MRADRLPLEASLEQPDTKRQYVRRLFATIADRYDLITVLLSAGRDRAWKTRLVNLLNVRAGDRVFDLACGTGDIAFDATRCGARVTGLDITLRMIELAKERPESRSGSHRWLVGDMNALPVASESYDVVTTGYGLRNVPDLPGAIAEIHRVLAPGGRVGSLDFDRPESPWLREIGLRCFSVVGGALGWVLHRDPDTYRYLAASIRRYPGARGVVRLMEAAGFEDVRHVRVFGGLMAIHIARKPRASIG